MKKVVSLILALALIVSLNACTNASVQSATEPPNESSITIPDVCNSEESVAKNLISSCGLFPDVEYRYDDIVVAGNVIETMPSVGSTVKKGDTITIVISQGPKIVKPKSGSFRFYDVYSTDTDCMKASVRKEEGILYIDCDVVFAARRYKVPEKAFASTDEDYLFSIPIKVTNISQSDHESGNYRNKFTIEIPLDELGDSNPTHIYLNLDRTDYPFGDNAPLTTRVRAWFKFVW
ncbi:MAG: PASTA domain-containing protein [Oscillospiraceae bacterium]|nr:PASTA domain-containing protein [Oscillospiraceae bacterium]